VKRLLYIFLNKEAEGGRLKTEGRGQKTEDRGQRVAYRGIFK
jgi:hypothetical protein